MVDYLYKDKVTIQVHTAGRYILLRSTSKGEHVDSMTSLRMTRDECRQLIADLEAWLDAA